MTDSYPAWGDIEHQQTDLELVSPDSDELRIREELPLLVTLLADGQARSPEEREHKRAAGAAVERLLRQLNERLRPYGMPEPGPDAGAEE